VKFLMPFVNKALQIYNWYMSALFVLILISLIVALGFLGAFIWAVRSGQMDDDYTPSIRILFDNETNSAKTKNKNS
jgi:cbb3-type cytochrome oxidase maturation protein